MGHDAGAINHAGENVLAKVTQFVDANAQSGQCSFPRCFFENKALIDGFRAMGAVSAPIPYPQIYTAHHQGTVDGTANDLLSVATLKLYEVAQFITISSYVVEPRPVIMSKDKNTGWTGSPCESLLRPGLRKIGVRTA